MALKSPNAVDVLDIQFKLYAKTKVLDVESVPNNVSVLAVSSALGLLFVGEPEKPELKVFMLNNLIDTENICNEILARVVPLPGIPNIIVCSSDGTMLAVSYSQNGSSFLQIFSVPSFLAANINVLHTIKVAPEENVATLQILWNPVISSSLAIILTNGALGMYTLKDRGQYEMHTIDKGQQVQCGCWSPKGKQIVLGFANGKLQQFKPDLTPAKMIVCPVGVHAGPFSTIAVHWLSTFQFAAAFVQDGEGTIPSLYIINAPKGGTPSYINYFDVCYTTGQRVNQINFTHVQQWNLLLVSSANGIEVGLLGCKESGEMPTWVQYSLLDEARIEMPLTDAKDETFPIGFAYDTSCTHHLTVNEKELPAMPMIHVLSTNGQLLSFNFLNLISGAPDLCSPPPPISYNTQQFRPLEEFLKTESVESAAAASVPAVQYEKTQNATPSGFMASTPLMKDKTPQFFGNLATAAAQQHFEPSPGFGSIVSSTASNAVATQATKTIFSGFGGTGEIGGATLTGLSSVGGLGQQNKLEQQQSTHATQPQPQPHLQQQQQQKQQQQQQLNNPQQTSTVAASGVKSSELNKPLYTVPPNFTPPTTALNAQHSQPQKFQSNLAISSKMQSGFLELILVQINAFDKEIKQLAAQSKGLLNNLGNPDEMRGCTKRLNDLQEIIEQANDHEFEMDVQNLRHFLTEARAMIAESRWKLEKYNNPDLPRLGNNTSDSVNRRQLAKLQSYLATNDAQLQVLKLQIDAQWSNFQDSMRRNTKSKIHMPCLDGIYQRMTKLQDTLSRQRQKLNQIKMKLQQNGLLYKITNADTSSGYVNVDGTIDSLADSILSMTLAPVVDESRSKLSDEKLKAIRDFTRQRKTVNIIKAHRPDRVGLRSEVVLETMLQSERIKARESTFKAEQKQRSAQAAESNAVALTKPEVVKPLAPPNQVPQSTNTSIPAFSFNNVASNTFIKPTTPSEKNGKPTAVSFSFKTPPTLSGFGVPVSGAQTQQASVEPTKVGLATTPEEETTSIPQVPISFAAKVISGTSTTPSKSSSTTFVPTSATIGFPGIASDALKSTVGDKELKTTEEASKPFSFTAGTATTGSIFSGFGVAAADAAAVPSTKPQLYDVKSGNGPNAGFSFAGFTSSTGNTVSTTPISASFFSSAPTTMNESSFAKPSPGIFSGFGKSIDVENNAVPLNLSATEVSTSSPIIQNLAKSSQVTVSSTTPDTVAQAATLTSSRSSAAVTSASTTATTPDPTDGIFSSLNICKPTTKPSDSTKSGNIFAGLSGNSGFSFTPVTGTVGNMSFGDLSKSLSTATTLTISPVTTAATASTAPIPAMTVTTTAALSSPSAISSVGAVKSSDFSFSLSSLGTSITTTSSSLPPSTLATSSTPILPTTPSVATSIFSSAVTTTTPSSAAPGIFASTAFPTTVTSVATSSAASTLFGGSTGTSFFTSTAAPTTTTNSTGGSMFAAPTSASASLSSSFSGFGMGTAATTASTTPASGVSIFSANTAGSTSPPNTNIFGGIPKPDQSVFGSAATQSPTSGGNLFANAAPNASPFGANATSPPPNQTVGGSIFGGASDGFPKSAGSIFGGNATAVTGAPVVSSPFGGAILTTTSSVFGSSAVKPAEGGSIFSNAASQPAAPTVGGSIFGQSSFGQPATAAAQTGLFATTQPAFGAGGSIFGGGASTNTGAASGGSIFGGITSPSSFGSPTNTAGSTGFGGFSQANTGSPFTSPAASSGPFGQGGASVAQSGFGSPQQGSAFSKPVFGGPPTFGSPPAFGAQPTFGGAPTFGTQKAFGSFVAAAPTSPPTGVFAGGAQKNSLFETLGASDTGLSFGNLAQGANATGPKPPFGGSSFTSYRS